MIVKVFMHCITLRFSQYCTTKPGCLMLADDILQRSEVRYTKIKNTKISELLIKWIVSELCGGSRVFIFLIEMYNGFFKIYGFSVSRYAFLSGK